MEKLNWSAPLASEIKSLIPHLAFTKRRAHWSWWFSLASAFLIIEQCASAATFFVATDGLDSNNGSITAPFATIRKALTMIFYGDTIYLRGGVYRQAVAADKQGNRLPLLETSVGDTNHVVTLQNYNGEDVSVVGSDAVTDWMDNGSPLPGMKLWSVPWTDRSQQVFVNGRLLGHVGWNAGMSVYPSGNPSANAAALALITNTAGVSVLNQNTTHMTNWSFYQDTDANILYIGLPLAQDPNASLIEVSRRIPLVIFYSFFHVRGIRFRHANTLPVTGGWPGVALSSFSTIEDCEIQWCDFMGLSTRDSCRVINCLAANNGMMGGIVVGTNILVTGCRFLTNHYLPFDLRGEAAGMKNIGQPAYLDNSRWINNEFGYNKGAGLWFDSMTVRDPNNGPVIVRGNYVHDNLTDGIFIEFMRGVLLINNLSIRNHTRSLYLSHSSFCWIYNNTLLAPIGSYNCLDIFDDLLVFGDYHPHDIWCYNNIMGTDETQIVPGQPESDAVLLSKIGDCVGATNILFDFNYYLVRGKRPLADYFYVQNLDKLGGLTGAECSQEPWSVRTDFVGWRSLGFDLHSTLVTNLPIITAFFFNEPADDYRVTADSPVAGAGFNFFDYFQDDIIGRLRPTTTGFTLGAYEYIDTLRVVATDASAAEPGGDGGEFTISRQAVDLSLPLVVTYTVGGTATPGIDYVALPGTVLIPADESSVKVPVTVLDDAIQEPVETVTVTINPLVGTVVSALNSSATVSIVDDDQRVSIVATDAMASEPGADTGLFTITREGPMTNPLTVGLAIGGTAAANDYLALPTSATIPAGQASTTVLLTPTSDTQNESTETVIMTIASSSTYTVGVPNNATINILNAPTVSMAAGLNALESGTAGTFIISRDAAGSASLTVTYSEAGTATAGSDYTALSGVAQIPAGASSVTITILPINDTVFEGTETISLTVLPSLAFNRGTTTASINLLDNEPPPAPTGLVANAGNKRVSLSWNASPSATSYQVNRATTSAGPYILIGSPGNTIFNNNGLVNGTLYYYKVSAVNAFGEGADSTVVSAPE